MIIVTIDLSLDDNSFKKSYDALFHKEKYEQLSKIIQNRLNFVEANKDDSENVNHNRSHQAVLLNGERGTGKTSILVNLTTFMKEEFKNIENKILFLDPVDPTLLNNNEDFLNVVIAQINKTKVIQEQLEKTKNTDCYYHSLEMLANALEGEQIAKNQTGLDKLLSYQGSLDIAQRTHEYFHEVLKFTDKKLIVIAIDDVDMSLHHGFEILEVVRKYLCSNYVLPIVSGDLNLYQELVHNEFFKQLVHKDSNQTESQKKQAFNLTIEYLRKVFPLHQRIYVPTIEQYCEKANLGQNVKIKNGENPICSLYEFHQWFLIILNGRVNGEENSIVSYTPKTVRELMQLLGALKPIFTEEGFSNLTEFCKLRNQLDDKKPDIKNVLAISLSSKTKKAEVENIYKLLDILSNNFKGGERSDLHYLCEALKAINKSENIFLNDLVYFNPIKQLEISKIEITKKRNNENLELYKTFDEQKQYLPINLTNDNEVYFLRALPAIEPVCNPLQLLARSTSNNSRNFYKYIDESPENLFLLKLFSHANYYTSYQNKPFIFFGKFFEIITVSLIRDIDVKWLQNLLLKPPYYSIISVNPTKIFDFELDNAALPEEAEEAAESEENAKESEFLKGLVDSINEFRKNNIYKGGDELTFIDISLFSAVQSKFFNQLNLYKKKNSNKLLQGNLDAKSLLHDTAIRAAYCYWSALGSFEKSSLFYEDARVSHTNFFAVNKNANNDKDKLKNNNAYRLNIEPLLELDSTVPIPFTSTIIKHPIYKFILNLLSEETVMEQARDYMFSITQGIISLLEFNRFINQSPKNSDLPLSETKREILLQKLNKVFDHIKTKTAVNGANYATLLKQAKYGEMLKTKNFPDESMGMILLLIWKILLEEDDSLKTKRQFIYKLKSKGVDKELASLLCEGI